jgi:hypothetical protein
MPRRQNKKAVRYDSHEEKVTRAIKELRENPDSKLKHVAAFHGLNRKTLFNRYYGRTQAARDAHPESRKLAPEEENAVIEWVEKRDTLGFPPKHKELTRMVVSMLNSKGQRCDRLGDHYTTRFLKRHPQVATTVAWAMDRDRVLVMNAASLETFFERLQLEDCISRNSIDPEDMCNFDEMGFMMGRGGKKNELVISRVRVKTPQRMEQGNREWVTLIECVSAAGIRLLAFCIYAGAAYYKGWYSSESMAFETVFAYTVFIYSTKCGLRLILTILFSFRPILSPHR